MIMVRATIKKRKKASFHLAFTPWLSNRLQSFPISAHTKKLFSSYLLDQMCGNFVWFCCVICFFKSKNKRHDPFHASNGSAQHSILSSH